MRKSLYLAYLSSHNINRITVEFKLICMTIATCNRCILIESQWNLNVLSISAFFNAASNINRITVEFKLF